MAIEIQNIKLINKGYLVAICDAKMPQWGNFIIHGISIFSKDEKRWFSFPSKEYEKEGQKKWFQHCRFENETLTEAFRKHLLSAFDKAVASQTPSVFEKPQIPKTEKTSDQQQKQDFQNQTKKIIDDLGEIPF